MGKETAAYKTTLQFQQSYLRVLKLQKLTHAEWSMMMTEFGYQFASSFSKLFGNMASKVEDLLLNSPEEDGEAHNWYWEWWKYYYLKDDYLYITEQMYLQPISYKQLKCNMLVNPVLEYELTTILDNHTK